MILFEFFRKKYFQSRRIFADHRIHVEQVEMKMCDRDSSIFFRQNFKRFISLLIQMMEFKLNWIFIEMVNEFFGMTTNEINLLGIFFEDLFDRISFLFDNIFAMLMSIG